MQEPSDGGQRFYIAMALHRDLRPRTAQKVAMTLVSLSGRIGWGIEMDALVSRSRSALATSFLFSPAFGDVLLFIDGDIDFEPNDVRLIVDDCLSGMDIVGGMYVVRDTTIPYPAIRLFPGQKVQSLQGEPVEAEYVSTGFMAIHRRVLTKLAETLPLCNQGHRKELYPFFMPMVHDGEYLSEDWACCQRAKEAGLKIWLDPRIRLAHLGERAYVLEDLSMDGFGQTAQLTLNEGGPDDTGVIPDLCTYWGMTTLELRQLLMETPVVAGPKKEWREKQPRSAEEVGKFYKDSEAYMLELVHFNTSPMYWWRAQPIMRAQGKVIDFGGGIGTLALKLKQMGRDVTYVEYPSPHREFAEFRFKRHGAGIQVKDSIDSLKGYDHVVAMDVMEHIHSQEIGKLAREMYEALIPGGSVIAVSDFGQDTNRPMHILSEKEFEDAMLHAGFKGGSVVWTK